MAFDAGVRAMSPALGSSFLTNPTLGYPILFSRSANPVRIWQHCAPFTSESLSSSQ